MRNISGKDLSWQLEKLEDDLCLKLEGWGREGKLLWQGDDHQRQSDTSRAGEEGGGEGLLITADQYQIDTVYRGRE